MSQPEFLRQVEQVIRLSVAQASLRGCLRAIWLGLGTALAVHAVSQMTGWFASPWIWTAAGIAAGMAPLVGILAARPKTQMFIWRLDRIFGTKQQLSTAYQEAGKAQISQLSQQLIEESTPKLAKIRSQILKKGWFLERDLVSLLIIFVLAICTYAESELIPELPNAIPSAAPEALPQVAAEPQKEDILQPKSESQSGPQSVGGADPGNSLTAEDMTSLMEAAQKMGEVLGQDPQTSELGEALQSLDIGEAADQLKELSEEASSLSDEAQQQLSEAMQAGAESLEGTNLENIAESLQEVQESLETGDPTQAGGSLDQLSEDLQQLMEQMAGEQPGGQPGGEQGEPGESLTGDAVQAGSAGDNREQGPAEDLSRLNSESDTLDLSSAPQDTSEIPGALKTSSTAQEAGQQTTTGSGSATGPAVFNPYQTGIYPYQFQWTWKYVVSRYFQPYQE